MFKNFKNLITLGLVLALSFGPTVAVAQTRVFPYQGGTGATSTPSKGSVLVGLNSSIYCVLGVGATGTVLTASSTATCGVSWEASVGGGGSATTTFYTGNATATGPAFIIATSAASNVWTVTSSGATIRFTIPNNLGWFSDDVGFATSGAVNAKASNTVQIAAGGLLTGGGNLTGPTRTITLNTSTLNDSLTASGFSTSSASGNAVIVEFIAGENINRTQAVRFDGNYMGEADINQASSSIQFGVCTNAPEQKRAQTFVPTSSVSVTDISIRVKRTNTPPSALRFGIQTTVGATSTPSGTFLAGASGTVAAASVSTTVATATITFASAVTLSASTSYAFVLECDTNNASDIYNWGYATPSVYGQGNIKYYGGTWAEDTTQDGSFFINTQTTQDPKVYLASAASATTSAKFVGVANETSTSGSAIDVVFSGLAGGFSNLQSGSYYFLTNTLGAMDVASGTTEQVVGLAVNTTTILMVGPGQENR